MPSLDLDSLFAQALVEKRIKLYRRFASVEARQERDGYYTVKGSGDRIVAHDFEYHHDLIAEHKGDWNKYRPSETVWGFQYLGQNVPELGLNYGDYVYSRQSNGTAPIRVSALSDFQLYYRQMVQS